MSALHLYNQLTAIRLTASLLYDKGRAEGHSSEQSTAAIQPLKDQVTALMEHAVVHDLPGMCMAIKMFETEAEKHERDAKYLLNKAEDTRLHANNLRDILIADLKKNKSTERLSSDFSITLVGEQLTIR